MAILKREVEFAKEVDDVLVLVVELLKDVKAKKDAGAIAAENIPGLLAALDGAAQIGEEAKNKLVVSQTAGYRLGELVAVILGESQSPVSPPPAA